MDFISKQEYEEIEKVVFEFIRCGSFFVTDDTYRIMENVRKLERFIHKEVMDGNFTMVYQPKVSPDGKCSLGAEALFRTNADFFINPEVIFTLFKLYDSEKEVVKKQIEKVCSDISELAYNISPNYCVSINVSVKLIDENFCKCLHENLKKNELSTKNIQIELLEHEDFENLPKYAIESIKKLRSEGVTFALDDYGTANASKSNFNKFHFDSLKIDKSIIRKANETGDYTRLANIYKMAHEKNPKIEIVVEGVENENEVKKLQEIGKFNYQGYYFSKPVKLEKIIEDYGIKKSMMC